MTTISEISVLDIDAHIIELPDLWTSRLPKRWAESAPHVVWDEKTSSHVWSVGDLLVTSVGFFSAAGWKEPLPSFPPTLEEADPAGFDPHHRLKRMDEYGIQAQVLYPNLVNFFAHAFMELEPALSIECVRAYNDYITEFTSVDRSRLVPLTMLPFWDTAATVKEMERCKDLGHNGVMFAALFDKVGLPDIDHEMWHPILDAAQSLGQSINLHVGFSGAGTQSSNSEHLLEAQSRTRLHFADASALGFLGNARAICYLTMHGVCHRYPDLKFVSTESGFGWIPFFLQGLDWQFMNSGVYQEHPEWELPSQYFHRQVFASFWFERIPDGDLVDFQDNLLFETDFPHPTSLSPSPNSTSLPPREHIEQALSGLPIELCQKILHDNAADLYGLA